MRFFLLALTFFSCFHSNVIAQIDALMPIPNSVVERDGKFRINSNLVLGLYAPKADADLTASKSFIVQLENITGLSLVDPVNGQGFGEENVVFKYKEDVAVELGVDESYVIDISDKEVKLDADTQIGILRGLQTLLQLATKDESGWYLPNCRIVDSPRFPWRGLLIDVCRHWMPPEMIYRNLDAMAAAKMNVLHLHLTEDQGFRIESKKFPLLHEQGSNGNYLSQDDIRAIIGYAAEYGIRVVPEFDMPGHATSWFVGHPELASAPGPYGIETGFGVFDPTIDPTREETYVFLDTFLTEMSALFPDEYMHIGGDENNGKQWNSNPDIQKWMKDADIKTNHALQAYFNSKLFDILKRNGKKMMGWDEIFEAEWKDQIMIQSWSGGGRMAGFARNGTYSILSNGYYIDLCQTAEQHYLNDPNPADSGLTEAESAYILGGEATMWAELVSEQTVDSRIWPRTAAIAERLWSPENVRDVKDMYRRLEIHSDRLHDMGMKHKTYREEILKKYVQGVGYDTLLMFFDIIEPVKGYQRHHQGVKYSTALPLDRAPDLALPESREVREFKWQLMEYVGSMDWTKSAAKADSLIQILQQWKKVGERASLELLSIEKLKPVYDLANYLPGLCQTGIEALQYMKTGKMPSSNWTNMSKSQMDVYLLPAGECMLPMAKLINALL